MKGKMKKFTAIILATLLVLGSTASAWAQTVENVTAQLRPDFTIIIDGSQRSFYTSAGSQVYPILYNGTTYLPLRATGELIGKNVNWDENSKTINLYGSRSDRTSGAKGSLTAAKNVSATLRGDFTVAIDGVTQRFTDGYGNTLYPLLYDGTTYLPLRAIGQIMGKNVSWNANTNTVTLTGQNVAQDSLVTDADSFSNTTIPQEEWNNYITLSKAKSIALSDAGLKSNQVTFVQAELENDHGVWQYDIEFYTANGKEYDYEIDALTGSILHWDYDAEHHSVTTPTTPDKDDNTIGEAKAKDIALNRAGLSASQVTFTKVKLDYDDGRWVYELKFYAGDKEYECDVDAVKGTISDWEVERND